MAESKINKRNQPCPQERRIKIANTLKRHGQCASATSGITPEFRSWCHMRGRCNNPKNAKYARYGGRGIKICEKWSVFENFYADMGARPSPKHTLNRINNDGDYCPDNCEWADYIAQANNKENTVKITYNGRTQSLADWAREYGLKPKTVWRRHRDGWTVEEILTKRYGVFLTHNGKTKRILEWAKELGVSGQTLYLRRFAGWSDEEILTRPFRPRKPKTFQLNSP